MTHHFEIVLSGVSALGADLTDRLDAAGLGDAVPSLRPSPGGLPPRVILALDREGDTLGEASRKACAQVEALGAGIGVSAVQQGGA